MAGSTLLTYVDQRLRQIFGVNQPSGGISVICVGDLHQLKPVGDRYVFLPPITRHNFSALAGSAFWDVFRYFELTQIMRQKNEKEFIEALNNLAIGRMTPENIELIISRQVNRNDVPKSAVRLYGRNVDVNAYNNQRIDEHEGEVVEVNAVDTIAVNVRKTKKGDNRTAKNATNAENADEKDDDANQQKKKQRATVKPTNALLNRGVHETHGLPHVLRLQIGIKYMVTTNVDIGDGLVNGASGILKHIHYQNNEPHTLYLQFDSHRVGVKARGSDKRIP